MLIGSFIARFQIRKGLKNEAGERPNYWLNEVAREVREPKRERYTARYRHKGRRGLKKEKQLRVYLKPAECPSAIELHSNTDYR